LIYSLGTSNRTAGELLDLFTEYGIEAGVDIRSFPTSHSPRFLKVPLQNLPESNGIQYEYLGKGLGGFRKGGVSSYYMETDAFRKGVERLGEIGAGERVRLSVSKNFSGDAAGAGWQ